jgi:multiple sugar transport system ATP-binding protein
VLGIRPEAMEDAALDPAAAPERVIELRVDLVEALGAELLIHASLDAPAVELGRTDDDEATAARTMSLVARLSPKSRIEAGDIVKLTVDTARLHLFDPATGRALRAAATAGAA